MILILKKWLPLNNQIILGGRQTKFLMYKNKHAKIRQNSLANKLYMLHDLIDLSDLNLSQNTLKTKMKKLSDYKKCTAKCCDFCHIQDKS